MFPSVNKSTLIDPERLRLNKWLQTKYQPNARSKIMELTISRTIGTRVGQKERSKMEALLLLVKKTAFELNSEKVNTVRLFS